MFKWLKTSVNNILSGQGSERSLVHIDDDGFMADDIQVNIEDIIAGEDNEEIGKLYVLSLTEFHTALGEMWDKREAKIFLLTEAVLRDYVGDGNRWEHRSKEVYVMLFPTLSQMEAEARTFDVAEQLGLKIIGERFDGERRPHIRFAGVDPKDALNEDGTFNIEALEKAGRAGKSAGGDNADNTNGDYKIQGLSEGGPEHAPPNAEQGPNWRKKEHESIQRPDKWKDNPHAHQDENGNWHENEHAAQEANTNWKKGQHHTGMRNDPNWEKDTAEHHVGPSDDAQWVSISNKEKTHPTAQKESSKATPTKSNYSLSFAPCWIRKTESLSHYKSLLNYETKEGDLLEGLNAYAEHKTVEQRLKIDLWVMQTTAKSLFPMFTKKVKTPIFIPIHSSSLREPAQSPFFEGLNKFSAPLRKDYFILEIIDDGEWDEKSMQNIVAKIKDLGLDIALSPSAKHDFKAPLCQGLSWVGLDLSILEENTEISPQRLKDLQSEITTLNAQSYVFGIKNRTQLADMLNLGAALLSGPALVRTTKKLRPAFDLPIERLQKAAGT